MGAADGTRIVLDCGTGAHALGEALVTSGEPRVRGHLLITHTHWDHIQGFPFFAPLFVEGNEWDVYAPQGLGRRLEDTLAGQMEYVYFPVTLRQLAATIRYHEIAEGSFDVGGVRVSARYLNHPGLTLGYRLEADGVVMVYATDHEPHGRYPAGSTGATMNLHREDQRHIEFLAEADLLVHDSQYTLDEYPKKVGWGHTPAERVVDFALAGRVKRLALFHHDPSRSDEALDRLLARCRQRVTDSGAAMEVLAAAEGRVIEMSTSQPGAASRPAERAGVATTLDAAASPVTILVVDDDPAIVRLLTTTLRPEGFHVLSATDGDTALAVARAERPDLVLLDWNMPGRDGLAVCRALRAESDPHLRNVPVVLVTVLSGEEDTAAGFAAGATDYITKPFGPAHVRSRVHTWLLRARASSPR